jgi:protein SCO1/2
MSFNGYTGFRLIHKVLLWWGAVSVALGLSATAVATNASAQKDENPASHIHSAEPAGHPPPAPEDHTNHSLDSISGEGDPHAHHRHMLKSSSYSRSLHRYALPDVAVVDMQGQKTTLLDEVNAGQPVMLNFIFTTCTTICPVLSATFSQVEHKLGAERDRVRMISITIDPEYDSPARLRDYAQRYDADNQWRFLTGRLEDIVAIQKAFDAYRGNKMSHEPLTFLRASAEAPWLRIDGLASAADVVREYRELVAAHASAP